MSRATLAIVCCCNEGDNVPKTCVNGFGNADELAHLRGSQGVDHVLPDVGRVPWRCLADLAPPNIGEARIGGTGDLPPVRLALGITAGAGRSVALFYAGILELIASILITAGLFTRTAAFVASGVMAFAFFTQHLPTGTIPMTNGGELAVLYCFAFFLLVFAGGGTFALDTRLNGGPR